MFDRLSSRLQSVVRNLRGFGTISEKNIQEALREVRLALLEADVHYATAKEFIERVTAYLEATGQTAAAAVTTPAAEILTVALPQLGLGMPTR